MLEPFFRRHDIKKNDILQNDTSLGNRKIYKPRPPFSLSSVLLSVFMLNVVAPFRNLRLKWQKNVFLSHRYLSINLVGVQLMLRYLWIKQTIFHHFNLKLQKGATLVNNKYLRDIYQLLEKCKLALGLHVPQNHSG